MKKFLNEEMGAPNVLRVPIDLKAADRDGWLRRLSGSKLARARLYSHAPPWRSNIRWYSSRFVADFQRFRSVFDRLGVAGHVEPYVDLEKQVQLFNSFLVVRSRCDEADFHVDWANANNEGFTLMTPLTDNCAGFGMLYRRADGSMAEYEYKPGEALIFGDDFVHSTKPGSSDEPVVLLCFNFGTDKMEYWPVIEPTAARQSILTCRPDGQFHRRPVTQELRHLVGRGLRRVGLSKARNSGAY